jgi:hypothetical protein
MSSLLTTQLIVSPPVILPEQPEEYVVVYPDTDASTTAYLPAFMDTDVPDAEPGKLFGDGLFPVTNIIKSDGFFVPRSLLITFLTTVILPSGGLI